MGPCNDRASIGKDPSTLNTTTRNVEHAIQGPVNSIPTPFTHEGSVDWDGVRAIIDSGIAGGSQVSLLTPGDSQFDCLTPEEIHELTRVLVEHVDGRAMTVAAVWGWGTSRAEAFAGFCRDLGVDCLMVLPTDRVTKPDALAGYYKSLAAVMPVMLVGYPPEAVLDLLVDEPNIRAFKEDGTLDYAVRTMARYGGSWRFITGGGYWRHYTQRPFGCRAYFSWWHSFRPALGRAYENAINQGNQAELTRLMVDIEAPLFRLSADFPGGFQSVWRGLFELNGVAERWMRPPHPSLSDSDMVRLAQACRPLGLTD